MDGDPREALALLKQIRAIVGNLTHATNADFVHSDASVTHAEYLEQLRDDLSNVLAELTAHSRSYTMLEQFMNQPYNPRNFDPSPAVLFRRRNQYGETRYDPNRYQIWHELWFVAVTHAESCVPAAMQKIRDNQLAIALTMNRKSPGSNADIMRNVNSFVHSAPPDAVVIADDEKMWWWYPGIEYITSSDEERDDESEN